MFDQKWKYHHAVFQVSIILLCLVLKEAEWLVFPDFQKDCLKHCANEKINVILITQSSSEHSICVGVEEEFAAKAKEAIDKAFAYEIETGKVRTTDH